MIVANRATLSGFIRTPFFFPLPGNGFLTAFVTISASTCHRHHWALVGCDAHSRFVQDKLTALGQNSDPGRRPRQVRSSPNIAQQSNSDHRSEQWIVSSDCFVACAPRDDGGYCL